MLRCVVPLGRERCVRCEWLGATGVLEMLGMDFKGLRGMGMGKERVEVEVEVEDEDEVEVVGGSVLGGLEENVGCWDGDISSRRVGLELMGCLLNLCHNGKKT